MKQFCALTFVLIICLACDHNSTADQDQSIAKITEVENRAINGQQWRITIYSGGNVDFTAKFAGYIFEFDSNNLLTATNGVENFSGNWSVANGGKDDNRSEFDDLDFVISFTNPRTFEELSQDWGILSLTDSKIELQHTGTENNAGDLLTFEKI